MSNSAKEVKILQFNQMKGATSGKRTEYKDGEVYLEGQKIEPMPGKYLLLEVDPKGNIVNNNPARMYEVKSTVVAEQEAETKVQKWSLEHKKNMVSQFGTSKSKRKLNQMMNNIIEWWYVWVIFINAFEPLCLHMWHSPSNQLRDGRDRYLAIVSQHSGQLALVGCLWLACATLASVLHVLGSTVWRGILFRWSGFSCCPAILSKGGST